MCGELSTRKNKGIDFFLDLCAFDNEMFYLNTIEQLFLFVEQLDQIEVCLPYKMAKFELILIVFERLPVPKKRLNLAIWFSVASQSIIC